jgi:dCTP deaminase
MTIKADIWIERMAQEHKMIEPFVNEQIREAAINDRLPPVRVISFGLSSYGYDIRVADEFKIFTNVNTTIVDPKNFDPKSFVEFQGPIATIPPNSFALARSVEYMRMPRNVTGIVLGKSTYARIGIITNFTPLEAGWEGHITIEISNTTPLPARIYAKEGIAQILFFESDEQCRVSYADRGASGGKYQGQTGITLAKV